MSGQFHKIDALIKEKSLKSSDALYVTTRHMKEGKIRILALKSDGIARCEYICPNCMKYGYGEAPWQRPFSIPCANCGGKINVPKMREQFKREQKAEKAKAKKKQRA